MNKSPTQEGYWNNVAEEKDFTTPFQTELFKNHVPKEARILDVGCGYGRTLNELYLSGFSNLSGVDFSEKMIERGNISHPHLDLRKNESGNLPYDDNSFDAVILLAVLTCIAHDTEQEKLIAEIERVVCSDGIICINDFLINTDKRNTERYKKYAVKYDNYGIFELPEGAVLRHHTRERVGELTNNFERIVFKTVSYITMNGNCSNGFYYMGRKK